MGIPKEQAEAALLARRLETPGNGWIMLSKDELLKALGLTGEFDVLGLRWSSSHKEVKVALRSRQIPWMGGEIVSRNPIHTEKELRDEKVAENARNLP